MPGSGRGEAPDWYSLLVAARALHQAPWDMAGLPETQTCYFWVRWAIDLRIAETWAENERLKQFKNANPWGR